jgi:thiol-disulfide isomerase/thioredoxin
MNRFRSVFGVAAALVALTAAVSLLASCGTSDEETPMADARARATSAFDRQKGMIDALAPDFTLTYHGSDEQVTLSGLRGEVVLLNFWGPWCAPCRDELPTLVALHNDYKDSGLVVLGVLKHLSPLDPKKTDVLIRHYDIAYRNATGNDAVFEDYGVLGYPTTVLVDRDGVLRQFVRGQNREAFEKALRTVM